MNTATRPIVFHQTSPEMIDLLRKRLEEAKGDWFHLSTLSGVPYFTIAKISQGLTKCPRMDTFVDLSRALDRIEAGEPQPSRRAIRRLHAASAVAKAG